MYLLIKASKLGELDRPFPMTPRHTMESVKTKLLECQHRLDLAR